MSTIKEKIKSKYLKHGKKGIVALFVYLAFKWAVIITLGTYLQSKAWWRNEYFLAFPLLILMIWLIRKRVSKPENGQV